MRGGCRASVPRAIGTWIGVHGENAQLRAEVARSRALLTRARIIAYDNRRLRALLRVRDRTPEVVIAARLVGSTASSGRRFALLNAGRLQGVQPGMPVRGPDGLVGRVLESGPIAGARAADHRSRKPRPRPPHPRRRRRDRGRARRRTRRYPLGRRDQRALQPRRHVRDLGHGRPVRARRSVAQVDRNGMDSVVATPFMAPDALDFAVVERPYVPMPPPPPARPAVP